MGNCYIVKVGDNGEEFAYLNFEKMLEMISLKLETVLADMFDKSEYSRNITFRDRDGDPLNINIDISVFNSFCNDCNFKSTKDIFDFMKDLLESDSLKDIEYFFYTQTEIDNMLQLYRSKL